MSSHAVYFAHSADRADRADWQPLAEHLRAVAALAEGRAAKFGAGKWGNLQSGQIEQGSSP